MQIECYLNKACLYYTNFKKYSSDFWLESDTFLILKNNKKYLYNYIIMN